jgi:hypothetical protein
MNECFLSQKTHARSFRNKTYTSTHSVHFISQSIELPCLCFPSTDFEENIKTRKSNLLTQKFIYLSKQLSTNENKLKSKITTHLIRHHACRLSNLLPPASRAIIVHLSKFSLQRMAATIHIDEWSS